MNLIEDRIRAAARAAAETVAPYSVPPLVSTRFTLWLPPKVWLHGSQSTITGRSAACSACSAA